MAITERTRVARPRGNSPRGAADAVTRYARSVVTGKIVAGEKVQRACRRHLDDLEHGHERGLRFNLAEAEHNIAFFPAFLRHWQGPKGPRAGQKLGDPVELGPFQQFIVGSIFGWQRWSVEHGRWVRRFTLAYVELAKKQGKSLTGAGIGLRMTFFDDEPGAEGYSFASKRDQAKIVWRSMRRAIRASPLLRSRLRVSDAVFNINDPETGSKFEPLGRDSDSDQGINPNNAIADELHVLKERDSWDNMKTAMAARVQPLLFAITTAGVKRESIWWDVRSDMIAILEGRESDDSVFAYIATLDEGDDPFDEAVWPKANPNLGVSVSREFLRREAATAQRSPGALGSFLRFHMNMPTAVSTRAIDIDEWDRGALAIQVTPGQLCYGGLDLASVRDLTAFLLLFHAPDGVFDVLCRFWCPEVGVTARSRRDGVPYAGWVRDGYLIATPGDVTDYAWVRAEIKALAEKFWIGEIGYDRWNAAQLATELGQDGAQMVPISQTFAGLAVGWRELTKLVLEGRLRHGGHPVLRWMAGNVEVETDASGNQRPSKEHSNERIDGMSAGTMAMARWVANGEPLEIGVA